MKSFPLFRASVAGLAGGIAWLLGVILVFGPAQAVLADPAWQSEKMIEAFSSETLPPRIANAPVLALGGPLAIGLLWGWVYVSLSASWAGSWWRRGARFAVVSWVLMVPWFEFYLPWNVLLEPTLLAAIEMICWAGVLTGVAMAIAFVDDRLTPAPPRAL